MKIEPLSRSAATAVRRDRRDIRAVPRTRDPQQHPFQRAREYTRALNATKLERSFAAPFVRALSGHVDGVYSMALPAAGSTYATGGDHGGRDSSAGSMPVSTLVSGSCDGEIRLWNASYGETVWQAAAHDGFVRGLSFLSGEGSAGNFLSCGDDRRVKLWNVAGPSGAGHIVTGSQRIHESKATSLLLHETQQQQQKHNPQYNDEQPQQQQRGGASARRRGRGGKAAESDDSDDSDSDSDSDFGGANSLGRAPLVWLAKDPLTGIDASKDPNSTHFVTSGGESVQVWDLSSSNPVRTISWGLEAVTGVYFNPVETDVFCSTGNDRAIALYDLRAGNSGTGGVLRKLTMAMRSNSVSWNPMEAFNFSIACDDHNAYTFDMRKLDRARCVHEGHTAAVMDVHWSPTGQELATASYDRTLRIFDNNAGRSRDIYHTKRMQRLFCVKFSNDARFVFTGSDDTNIRVWKVRADASLAPKNARQERATRYGDALKAQFAHAPEIRRISRQRRVPGVIKKETKLKHVMKESRQRKLRRVMAHSKPGAVEAPKAREKTIVNIRE